MAWTPSPWQHPMQPRPFIPDPWALLRQRDAQMQSLQLSIDARDRQIAAMTKSQQVHNGGKKAHKNEMERVLKEKDFFLKRCREIENKMTENDVKIESLRQENTKLKTDKKREIALDEKLISDLKKRCHDFEGENAELQRKNQKLENRVSQLEGDVKSLRSSLWLGNDNYSEPLIARLEEELKTANEMFDGLKEKVKNHEKEIAARNDKLQNCKVNMEEKDSMIRSLEGKNAQKEAHINNLQSQIVRLNSYKKSSNKTLEEKEEMEKKIKSLESQLNCKENYLKKRIESIESQIRVKENKLKMMDQQEANIKNKTINKLRKRIGELENQLKTNKLRKRIEELEKQLKTARAAKEADDDIQSIEKVQIQKIIIPEITIIDNDQEEKEQTSNVSEFQFDSENTASKPKKMKMEMKAEKN